MPEPEKVPYLKIAGADLPEMGFDPTALLGGGAAQPKAFFRLIETIDDLARSSDTEVLFDLSDGVGLNLAQQREIERAMQRLSAAGKRVEVIHLPKPKSFADSLFESMFEARIGHRADAEFVRLALADSLQHSELFGVLRQALTSDGKARIYPMMPAGLRVR